MKNKFFCSLILGACLAAPATADDNLAGWIERAAAASKQLNYTGTLALIRGKNLKVLHIRQGFDGQNVSRYIKTISGKRRLEVLRRGMETYVAYPDRHLVIHGVAAPEAQLFPIQEGMGHVAEYYHLEDQGQEAVAQRNCRAVRFTPRDHYRYGCELCVDQESGLLLRAQVMTLDDEILEEFVFIELTLLDELPEDSFQLSEDTRDFQVINMPYGTHESAKQWKIRKMPPGFSIQSSVVRMRQGDSEPVHHIIVSDALTQVSVFVDSSQPDAMLIQEQFREHVYQGYTTMLQGHQVTVIGNAPIATVRMIGESLQKK